MNRFLTRSVATAALTAVITALMPGGATASPTDESAAAVDAASAPLLAATVIQIPIAVTTDDAIQGGGTSGNFVDTLSTDNEFGNNGVATPVEVVTGLRFPGIPAPPGSEIVSAKIQFQTDEVGSDPASYTISGHAADNAPTFVHGGGGDITGRPSTTAQVPWSPVPWTVIGAHGPDQQTPELKGIVQEIVDRPGWAQGNAVAFVVDGPTGTGRRTAEAVGGTAAAPPVLRLEFQETPNNSAPTVDAGPDRAVTLPSSASLNGTVTDDGLPNPPGTTTKTWTKVTGPGDVTFGTPGQPITTAAFSEAGTYVLRLTADDSLLSTSDDVTVTVAPAEIPNAPPTVSAGVDGVVVMPNAASLNGTVSDDGLPTPPGATTTEWSEVDGPGTVTFGDAAAVDTTAAFSEPGTYVLRLTADDSLLSTSDEVTVTVEPAETPNTAPEVNAGPPTMTVTLPASANLDGTVADDGLPTPPGATTTEWSEVSGPGTVTFGSATAIDTTATFSAAGPYVLRLSANDGALSATDTVTVTVQKSAPSLTAQLERPAVLAGSKARIKGTISPAAAQTPVHLQRWNGSRWVVVQQTTLPAGASGTFAFVVKPGVSGIYRYRVLAPAHEGRAPATAPDNPQGLRLFVYNAKITRVKPNGDEFMVIRNTGAVSLNLGGWRLRNNANGRAVALPSRSLPSGGWVRVHTGNGTNGGHDLYLRKRPMWGERGMAVLRDARTLLVDQQRY